MQGCIGQFSNGRGKFPAGMHLTVWKERNKVKGRTAAISGTTAKQWFMVNMFEDSLFVEGFDGVDPKNVFTSLSSVELDWKFRVAELFKHDPDLYDRRQFAKIEFFRAHRP